MAKRKRWGKKFIDEREWKVENKKYVVKGEFLLDLKWVKNWDKELDDMNRGKRGSPFEFPESFIELQAVWSQWISSRGLEGIAKKLNEYNLIPYYNCFSTINARINKINTDIELPKEGNICVSTDASGMKMSNRGEYKEKKYGDGKRKYVKVTISADPYEKKLLKVDVAIEGEGDSEPNIAMSHLDQLIDDGFNIKSFFGDGGYDVHDLFDKLEQYNIKSGIKIRKNASLDPDSTGSWRRKQEVLKYMKKKYKKWAKERHYGIRWPGTEGLFSAIKRIFGENTRSRNIDNMIHEVKRKFWAYDKMASYTNS